MVLTTFGIFHFGRTSFANLMFEMESLIGLCGYSLYKI